MNMVVKITFLCLSSMALSACLPTAPTQYVPATESGTTPPTAMNNVSPAANPLMKLTKNDLRASKTLSGEAAIRAANQSATQQPNSTEYINAVMTFAYESGALYQIYSAPLNITDIQFQPGEKIISVAAGDTLRWQVSKTYSGDGADKIEHIVLKPASSGITNSLVVTTDRRTYHLSLHATKNTAMASVRWQYPGDGDLVQSMSAISPSADSLAIDVNHIDTNYTIKLDKGQKPSWYPKTVFNDGKKTYIQFTNASGQLPTLFVGTSGTPELINYRVAGNYFVVDTIINDAQLRSGSEKQTLVLLHHNS